MVKRLSEKTNPLGKKMFLDYDSNGNIISEKDYNGNIKNFEYNSDNKIIKKILPDNEYVFDYNIQGNIILAKNRSSQVNLDYEKVVDQFVVKSSTFKGLNSLSQMKQYSVEYAFDTKGNKIGMLSAFGEFQYDFDSEDRLTKIVNHKDESFDFEYDDGSRLSKISRPGSITNYSFDNTNFLTNIDHKKSDLSKTLNSYVFTRDNIGNKLSSNSSFENMNYGYDLESELTSLTHSDPASSETFTYDKIGNRLTDNLGAFKYDPTKQLLTEDYNYLYFYDDNGNMTSKVKKGLSESINYFYSSENQLIGFELFENNVKIKEAHYFYGPLGKRIKKEVVDHKNNIKSFKRQFVFDGNEVLAQLDDTGEALAIYTHSELRTDDVLAVDITTVGKDEELAKNTGSLFYLKDALGSIIDVADSSGNLVQHYSYSAFGKILKIVDGAGVDITNLPALAPYFTYTNREYDEENGLYYYRARFYSPEAGRFLSVDPFEGKSSKPITVVNRYAYVSNNSINYADPTGKASLWAHINPENPESQLFNSNTYCGSNRRAAMPDDVGSGVPNYGVGVNKPDNYSDRICVDHDVQLQEGRDYQDRKGGFRGYLHVQYSNFSTDVEFGAQKIFNPNSWRENGNLILEYLFNHNLKGMLCCILYCHSVSRKIIFLEECLGVMLYLIDYLWSKYAKTSFLIISII